MATSQEAQKTQRKALVERAAERLRSAGDQVAPVAHSNPVRAVEPKPSASVERLAARPGDSAGSEAATQASIELDLDRLRERGIWVPNGVRSRINEEVRVIKVNALQLVARLRSEGSEKSNVLMITSCGPDEGKTFTAINLAMSIAVEKDYEALLVDADFNRRGVPKTLGIETNLGLVDVLEDPKLDIESAIVKTNFDGLSILPAGRESAFAPELLASSRMQILLADLALRDPNRIVILDASPALATSEPSVLAKYVGQTLFVIGAGQTTTEMTAEALGLVGKCPNVGFVLNKASPQFSPRQFGSYFETSGSDRR